MTTTPSPERQPADAGGGLLPCPFCGGEASIERFGNTRVSTIYICDDCGCQLETGEEFNHGRAWNRRSPAPQAQPDARAVEALERIKRWSDPTRSIVTPRRNLDKVWDIAHAALHPAAPTDEVGK